MRSRFSKRIVTLVIVLNVLYTGAVLFVYYHTGTEPVALTTGWYAFTGTELLALAGLKYKEAKNKEEDG